MSGTRVELEESKCSGSALSKKENGEGKGRSDGAGSDRGDLAGPSSTNSVS